jgi:hypothetical protein
MLTIGNNSATSVHIPSPQAYELYPLCHSYLLANSSSSEINGSTKENGTE